MLQSTAQAYTANQANPFSCQPSRFIRCTQGNAAFTLRAWDELGGLLVLVNSWQAGLSVGPLATPATRMEVTNGSTAQTIELYYGDSEVQDNRLVGTVNITGGLAAKILGPTVCTAEGAVSATGAADLIWTGNALGAMNGILQNRDSAISIYYGHTSGVTTATGIELPAGGVVDGLDCALDLYVIVASGTVDVRFKQYNYA
jgi:hypothetical protein